MRNKRGIAPVIATVLLIVITIVVVALVIAFVIPFINEQMGGVESCYGVTLNINTAGSCYDFEENTLFLRVGRGEQEFDLAGIVVRISTEDETRAIELMGGSGEYTNDNVPVDLPGKFEERTYEINLTKAGITQPNVRTNSVAAMVNIGKTAKPCAAGPPTAIRVCVD